MTVYWTMLLLPALFAITPIRLNQKLQPITWRIFGSVLIIIIGLRHEVGGDWIRYLDTAYGIQKGTDLDFSLNFFLKIKKIIALTNPIKVRIYAPLE